MSQIFCCAFILYCALSPCEGTGEINKWINDILGGYIMVSMAFLFVSYVKCFPLRLNSGYVMDLLTNE